VASRPVPDLTHGPTRGPTRGPRRSATARVARVLAAAVLVAGCSAGGSTSDGAAPAPTSSSPDAVSSTPDAVSSTPDAVSSTPGSTPGTAPGTSPGTPPTRTAGASTPDAAALAVTTAWFSWDTRVDGRPNDTARRLAPPWLAPALRRQVLAFTSDAAPGAEWAGWTARHARATVAVALGGDDHPPDGPTQAWRQVGATIALVGDAGWTATVERTVFVRLEEIGGLWFAADLTAAAPA